MKKEVSFLYTIIIRQYILLTSARDAVQWPQRYVNVFASCMGGQDYVMPRYSIGATKGANYGVVQTGPEAII